MIRLTESDLRFLVETVVTQRQDHDRVIDLVRGKDDLLEPMLDDPKLVERLLSEAEVFARISPYLLFALLLRRVRRALENEVFVYEVGARGQRIPVFEAPQVVGFLSATQVRDYLVELLCSFVRTQSGTVCWQERGQWHQRRFSDLDFDDMVALCRLVPPANRPLLYQRIADLALFLSGIYPDHVALFVARPQTAFRSRRTVADYEEEGQRFYGLAAREAAGAEVRAACQTLSEKFTLARRALNTLSDRYLKSFKARPLMFPNN